MISKGLGFRVQGFGSTISGQGFRVKALASMNRAAGFTIRGYVLRFTVYGLRFRFLDVGSTVCRLVAVPVPWRWRNSQCRSLPVVDGRCQGFVC